MGTGTDSRLNIQSQTSSSGTSAVHGILVTGDNWGDDVIVLGRTDDKDSSNVVLNAKVGIGTHTDYPTGPVSDFQTTTSSLAKGAAYYAEVHMDTLNASSGGKISGVGITAIKGVGAWEKSFSFLALDTFDTRTNDDGNNDARLGGYIGYGEGDTLKRLTIGRDYNDATAIHWDMVNNRCGIGTLAPTYELDIQGSSTQTLRTKSSGGDATLRLDAGGDSYYSRIYFDKAASAAGDIYYEHDSVAANQALQFRIGDAASYPLRLWGDGSVGINKTATPLAQLHVVGRDASSEPVLRVEQLDTDQAFIRFEGDTASDATKSTSTATTTSASIVRQVRVQYDGGGTGWIRIYDGVS